jgi:Zn-dependent protease with chaperone function
LWAIAIAVVARGLHDSAHHGPWRDLRLAIVIALVAWRTAVAPLRRTEYRADTSSAALVGRDVVLATLRHLHAETPRYFRAVAASGFETHPSPRQRLRHVQRP